MPAPRGAAPASVGLDQAEAAIIEHYPRLVRLGYLVLPPALGRHRRALTAHGLVQRALPRGRKGAATVVLPGPRDGDGAAPDAGFGYVRLRVLRAALEAGRPLTLRGRDLRWPPRPAPALPRVLGLRAFPRVGGTEELALEQALSAVPATARAAYVLHRLEGLSPTAARGLLTAAGVGEEQARTALRTAQEMPGPAPTADGTLPGADACALQVRPTDLLRRRQYARAAAVLAAALSVLAGALLAAPGEDGPGAAGASAAALAPGALVRAESAAWEEAARLDFSVWPARGPAVDDAGLLGRAVDALDAPGPGTEVSGTPGTALGPAAGPPRLLYAGHVDGASVVLLHDGLRLIRYAEEAGTGGGAVLDFARTDGAEAASASALVLNRTAEGSVRFLTAPWVTDAAVRDLRDPASAPVALALDADGVTAAMASPVARETCAEYPVLEVTGRGGTPPALLADLAELLPARLTFGAPDAVPGHPLAGAGARRWAGTACHLPSVAGSGVRSVNAWQYATQRLPEDAGTAAWVCVRAETWRGAGATTLAQFQAPGRPAGEPAAITAEAEGGTACGPRAPEVLSGVLWRSGEGGWYLLAAGSEQVASIAARGDVEGRTAGRLLAVEAAEGADATVSATLRGGGELPALG